MSRDFTKLDLVCDVTEYMDKFRDPKQCHITPERDWMKTYICGRIYLNENGEKIIEAERGEYTDPKDNEKFYFWWVRIPGYTCANIIFNKKDDTVENIVLTRRGGAFSGGMETMYLNPNKLEKELNELFKGKKSSELNLRSKE